MPHEHGHSHAHATPQQTVKPLSVVSTTTPPTITVSERAAKELQTIMASEGGKAAGLKIGVEPGGCAGYQYALSLAASASPEDYTSQSQGVNVFVAKADASKLQGLVIDFVDSAMGSGFHIKNPNATHTCGCGNTFDA